MKKIYNAIINRCTKENSGMYYRYGGRGIKCEWTSYKDFERDMLKSYLKHVSLYGKDDTQIDRKDNDGNYCKKNCRWVTRKQNNRNKSNNKFYTFMGKKKTLGEWAEILDVPFGKFQGIVKTRGFKYVMNNLPMLSMYFKWLVDKNAE